MINYNRQLVAVEDLLLGVGTTTQTRLGEEVTVTRINAALFPYSETQTLEDVYNDITTKSNSAAASAVLASRWASESEDTIVADGEYSAKHYAAKASADAALTAGHLTAIETIYDNFDDRYLGAYATDPTLDNDGNPLQIGAIYFNTTDNTTRFYNGTVWEVPETTASQAAAAALASEQLADRWANEAEDVEVEPGKYSAKHHAIKAAASAASVDPNNTNHIVGSGLPNETYTVAQLTKTIGNINKYLCKVLLLNSINFEGAGIASFSRNSTATYVDKYEVLKYSAVDEPRFEKDGLLIEGSGDNLFLHSEDITNGAWVKNNGAVVAGNSIVAPDGNITMDTLTSDGIASSNIQQRDNSPVNGPYTHSRWVKQLDSTEIGIVIYNDVEGFDTAIFDFTTETFTAVASNLTAKVLGKTSDGSYRISVSRAVNTGTFIEGRLYPQNPNNIAVKSVYTWGAQLEPLEFASSYIPTTNGAGSRSNDLLEIDSYANAPLGSRTYLARLSLLGTVNNYAKAVFNESMQLLVSQVDNEDSYVYISNESGTTRVQRPSGKFSLGGVFDKEGGTLKMYHNGIKVAEDLTATTDANNIGTAIRLGHGNQIYGHYEELVIYGNNLTDVEMNLLG